MEHLYLLPVFIVVILLNFVLMWMIIIQEIKYKNVSRIGRFFTLGVIIFLLCANLFRAVYLLYLVIQSPDRHFNRYRKTEEDLLADYFSHFPWLFFGLASITFLFKWIDDYYGVPVNWNFNLKKSIKIQKYVKIVHISICFLTFAFFIIWIQTDLERFVFRLWVSILFYLSAVGLQITSCIFLAQLKKYAKEDYLENHK